MRNQGKAEGGGVEETLVSKGGREEGGRTRV